MGSEVARISGLSREEIGRACACGLALLSVSLMEKSGFRVSRKEIERI